ncbi:hypothetical protein PybrP1_013161 [[Pythium] brassicae (nom. inval.)]|nr:hypothetical protein PybrP1_013161 [[Pythium] brassicae (nom. inval.)]
MTTVGGLEPKLSLANAAAESVLPAQAYRMAFHETVAPPGGPLSRVIRPPVDFPPESKRASTIEDAEVELEEDMEEFKAAVHTYNMDFQARIDAVKQRGRDLEDRIGAERQDMELAAQQLQSEFRRHFQSAFLGFEQKTLAHFARVEAQQVAGGERQTRECDADFRTFAYTTVPAIMEQLQGSITRKLDKNHETFDIENAKIRKREKKSLGALESTERRTAAAFGVERARRVAKLQEREEEAHHAMRVDNRGAEHKQCDQVATLGSLQHQLRQERSVREAEDLEILDKLAASFHQLQSSILESLGDAQA